MIDQALLAVLICPVCKSDLLPPYQLGENERLLCSRAGCPGGGWIRDGVVTFEGDPDRGFDFRWKHHPTPQATTAPVWRDKVGWGPADLAGRVVLDAGCGVGRFAEIATGHGAQVLALDSSPAALDACARLVPGAWPVQSPLVPLPLRDGAVDLAYCIGVLHHLKNPTAAVAELARVLKPGGRLAIWVYPERCPPELRPWRDWLHYLTSRCPPQVLHDACALYAPAMRDGLQRLHEANSLVNVVRCSKSADDDECVSDTFDWHCPEWRWESRPAEVLEWYAGTGLEPYVAVGPWVTIHAEKRR
jgi:SAM-dependent methyltransferase